MAEKVWPLRPTACLPDGTGALWHSSCCRRADCRNLQWEAGKQADKWNRMLHALGPASKAAHDNEVQAGSYQFGLQISTLWFGYCDATEHPVVADT